MKQIIFDFPKQFKVGIEKAANIGLSGEFDSIVICGLGGSAMPGILLIDAFGDDFKMPVYIHRSYNLPKIVSPKSLIICISFSGNTEETLSAYQEAVEKKLAVVALSTGGKLAEMAKENSLPYCLLPNDCQQPRFGTGYLFGAVIKILENCGIFQNKSTELLEMAKALKPEELEKQGEQLAKKLNAKIPLVYVSNRYKAIGRIIKIKFNENSKAMAFWNYFPELNHNEMCGLTNMKGDFYFLIIKDPQENPQIIKRMELTAELIREAGAEAEIIEMPGQNKLEKMFNTLLLFDWTSYYLALALGVEPIKVPIVEDFKKRLTQ